MKHWSAGQLAALRRLRERFLSGTAGEGDYWRSAEELELYDATFGERIGWKLDAVLADLARLSWRPRSRQVLDWGCGSGIAGRRVLAQWPHLVSLSLHDRSPLATRFAAERARAAFPHVRVRTFDYLEPETLLVVSNVLNELPDAAFAALLELARQATEVLWIEPGTHAESRRLIGVREALLECSASFQLADGIDCKLEALEARATLAEICATFRVVAPCTHRARCGLLAPENGSHWCHHFAPAPAAIFQDARWVEFGREMSIDLRSVPYSYVVLERAENGPPLPAGFSRVIGRPREAKGYLKVLSCEASGVAELMLQKRDAAELFRAFRKGEAAPVQRWTFRNGKIVSGEVPPLGEAAAPQ
ncbi:MAG: small ribosomal subunit Rsm22 family protein [Verrucomicrobiota bacterium]|nr:small ribosomal subunit Rsm22 family protein [Verrucomicrobiota bacterium]